MLTLRVGEAAGLAASAFPVRDTGQSDPAFHQVWSAVAGQVQTPEVDPDCCLGTGDSADVGPGDSVDIDPEAALLLAPLAEEQEDKAPLPWLEPQLRPVASSRKGPAEGEVIAPRRVVSQGDKTPRMGGPVHDAMSAGMHVQHMPRPEPAEPLAASGGADLRQDVIAAAQAGPRAAPGSDPAATGLRPDARTAAETLFLGRFSGARPPFEPTGHDGDPGKTDLAQRRVLPGTVVAKGGIAGAITLAGFSNADLVKGPKERVSQSFWRVRALPEDVTGGPLSPPQAPLAVQVSGEIVGAAAAVDRPALPQMTLAPDNSHGGDMVQTQRVDIDGSDIKAALLSDTGVPSSAGHRADGLTWPARVRLSHFPADIRAPLTALVAQGAAASMQITLDPVELGPVRIALHAGETGLQVQILAERIETLELMRRFAHELARDLAQLGFGDVAMGFSQRDGRDGVPWAQMMAATPGNTPEPAERAARPQRQGDPIQDGRMDLRI